jgi:hypothetical protein
MAEGEVRRNGCSGSAQLNGANVVATRRLQTTLQHAICTPLQACVGRPTRVCDTTIRLRMETEGLLEFTVATATMNAALCQVCNAWIGGGGGSDEHMH